MNKKLRILILEDVPEDAELMEISLRKAGIEFASKRVETKEAFIEQLEAFAPDLLLLDYQLPQFDGMSALRILKERGASIPAIIVTASTNEVIAVDCMKAGAADYVLKDHLARLAPAVENALEDERLRDGKALAEEAIRASAQLWQATFDAIEDMVAILDRDFRVIQANKAMMDAFADREVVGARCYELIHASKEPPPGCPTCQVFQSGKALHGEMFEERLGGRWLDIFAYPIKAEDGGVEQMVHVVRDVTERRQIQEALRVSEEKYRLLVENANEGIAVAQDGVLRFLNPKLIEITGYSREELTSKPFVDFIHPDDRETTEERHRKRLDGESDTHVYAFRFSDKDGNIKWLESNAVLVEWEGRPATLNFLSDVTDRVKAEEAKEEVQTQLLQSQKMEAIGRLAGGVAHDFNNVLTAVLSYSHFAMESLDPNDPIYKDLEEVRKAGHRAAALTRQLLAFSRKQILAPKVLDINNIISDMEKMLKRLIGEDVALAAILDPEVGRVKADPGQIEQVIMNLAVNARDAMPQGGALTIETANVVFGEEYSLEPGDYVMIAVSDTGGGIDAETQSHIFDPFFTTKEEGKGTGLGLSTVYGIIKQSGGDIQVASVPGQGATFRVYLPQIEAALDSDEPSDRFVVQARGSETVLLVEDEGMVKELARRTLHKNGYTVLEACNAGEALVVSEQHDGPIHLMLTDVVMPLMSGPDLAKRLAPLRPDMKVLYMSGHIDNDIVLRDVVESGLPLIQKPFMPDGLTRKVRGVLDA